MAFFGLGRKQEVKQPLTEPLPKEEPLGKVAELPPQDILEDKGLPSTPSITSSESIMPSIGSAEKKTEDFFNEPVEDTKKYPGYQQQGNISEKDIELISSKLDYLKAAIDNISQRLVNLENFAKEEQGRNKYRW